ncbi:hypothetical protein [Carboxylicivirga taeanensis]|uniref:hypothetical protein n=1 Tax=Carboxylicivirga taeanensis TaxID=1416875 RepID=UPI003F6DA8CB
MKNSNIQDPQLTSLIKQLKTKDAHYAGISKGLQILYWVLCPFYLLIIAIHIVEGSSYKEIISTLCFLTAMISFAFLFRKYQKEYSEVDYSQPTLLMLKNAVNRYQLFWLRTLGIIPGILLVDIGLTLNAANCTNALLTQLIFLGAIGIALTTGAIWAYKQYKPLRDQAQALIDEIESV